MNKKISIFLLLIVVTALTATVYVCTDVYGGGVNAAQNMTSNINTARFIMFAGSYNINGSEQVLNGVFKLDTYTGQVWKLRASADTGGNISDTWVQIPNPVEQPQIPAILRDQIKELKQ